MVARAPLDGGGRSLERHINAVLREDRADRLGDVRILAWRELRRLLDDGDAAAEAPEGLRHLEADIAAAEHDQMRGKPIELERLDMGQRRGAGHPRYIRDRRARAEIEKDALPLKTPRATLRQPDLDRPGRNEAALAENEFQTVGRKARLVDRDHAVDHLALAPSYAGHVHGPGAEAQSECRGMANEVHDLGAVDHVLAGQAGDVGT